MARIDQKHTPAMEELFQAILSLKNEDECGAFFHDLCTMQELISLSQRLQVAKRLLHGETYDAIRQALPVSSSTITRINTALQFGEGGYQTVLERMDRKD